MNISHRHGEAGLNLIELMVAIVIIAVSVLALYEMFIQGTSMLTEEYHRRTAYDRSVAMMEKLKSYRAICDTVPRSLSGRFQEYLVDETEEEQAIEAEYSIDITHSRERKENGMPYNSEVVLKYTWTERSGKEQEIEFRSAF